MCHFVLLPLSILRSLSVVKDGEHDKTLMVNKYTFNNNIITMIMITMLIFPSLCVLPVLIQNQSINACIYFYKSHPVCHSSAHLLPKMLKITSCSLDLVPLWWVCLASVPRSAAAALNQNMERPHETQLVFRFRRGVVVAWDLLWDSAMTPQRITSAKHWCFLNAFFTLKLITIINSNDI